MSGANTTSMYHVTTVTNIGKTPQEEKIPLQIFIPELIIMILECLAIVILNAIVIAVLVRKKDLFRQCRSLIISLAIVDALVGAVSGPMAIPWNQTYSRGSQILDDRLKFFLLVSFTGAFPQLSILHLTAVSLERLHATFYPIKHRTINKRVYHVVIFILWVGDFLGNVILITATEKSMGDQKVTHATARRRFYLVACCICLICLVIVGISYFLIFIKTRYGAQRVNQQSSERDRRLTVTLFLVTILSFLTWLPLIIFFLAGTTGSSSEQNLLAASALRFLTGLNSLVNPLLYILRVKDFGAEAKRLLQEMFNRNAASDRNVQLGRVESLPNV